MRNAIPLKTPRAAEVLSSRDGTLRVRFRNGEIRDFNARKELFGLPCYRELANDPALFETAHVDYNTVVWNKQLDVDPDWLYHQSTPVHN